VSHQGNPEEAAQLTKFFQISQCFFFDLFFYLLRLAAVLLAPPAAESDNLI